jgi:monofunctional biosynthetic peptidoglycan transglycosylase
LETIDESNDHSSPKRSILRRIWRFCWKAALWFFITSVFSVILFRWVPIPFTPLMVLRSIEYKLDGKDVKLHKQWKPLEELSPHLQLAVVCTEDQNFLWHHGIDFGALEKALDNSDGRARRRGASTISQQVAKNVFLWNGRNYVRKGLEVYFTGLIELFWSKQRIMEVYLNVAEMGTGIYGAEAAAQAYFKRPAAKLTKEQAATLASILPNPRRYSATRPGPYIQRRINWTLQQMRFWGGKLDYDRKQRKKRGK